jgi:hypothetical protein
MGLSKKHNIELFDNISYIIKFISETSNVAIEDEQYIFIRNIGNLTRRLDLEHEHVESMWYELKTKLHNILININYRSERQSHIYYWQYFEHMLKLVTYFPVNRYCITINSRY